MGNLGKSYLKSCCGDKDNTILDSNIVNYQSDKVINIVK